jgi:hypothetical protein
VNYYESVVKDCLRADRDNFVNAEFCIQTNKAANPDNSGPHWERRGFYTSHPHRPG